ncbi:hypothetical protein [Oceanicella sp. SM1341]|uniref:hypothetical protein n=1 Tax=Oceanicella sp. SM1341 TaxID=1548889 RepID=UPI000E4DA441|nr:hypothetical protein [Oceanicella sp. SM1341]
MPTPDHRIIPLFSDPDLMEGPAVPDGMAVVHYCAGSDGVDEIPIVGMAITRPIEERIEVSIALEDARALAEALIWAADAAEELCTEIAQHDGDA